MNIDNFKETEANITLHGLGFLQVKLQGKQRLHVWHPELPRRSCFRHSQIHDHRFSFVSTVLVGEITNVRHHVAILAALPKDLVERFTIPATHVSYLHEGERTQFGNRPWIADQQLHVKERHRSTIKAGGSYRMDKYEYHSTEVQGKLATLMTKTDEGLTGAHSLCEVNVQPDVDFDRNQWNESQLWEIVRDVLGSA